MPLTYPVLAIEPHGPVDMLDSGEIWHAFPIWRFAAYRKRRERIIFFGKDGQKWRLKTIETHEPAGFLSRLFHPVRKVAARVEFDDPEPFMLDELKAAFKSAVEADDDILAQYYSREQILKWLEEAHSIAKVFNLYRFIRKDFRRGKVADASERG